MGRHHACDPIGALAVSDLRRLRAAALCVGVGARRRRSGYRQLGAALAPGTDEPRARLPSQISLGWPGPLLWVDWSRIFYSARSSFAARIRHICLSNVCTPALPNQLFIVLDLYLYIRFAFDLRARPEPPLAVPIRSTLFFCKFARRDSIEVERGLDH